MSSALLVLVLAFAIYGDDDRLEADDPRVSAVARAATRATGLIISRHRIGRVEPPTQMNADWRTLPRTTLKERYNLCEGERFGEQPAPGYCTGFLVGPDLAITAGHCIRSSLDCSNAALVFDFLGGDGHAQPHLVKASDVYTCRALEAQRNDQASGVDFALIRLDRQVEGREPLKLRQSGDVVVGDPVSVVGHPLGLPLKVAPDARVRATDAPGYFVLNSDTSSGSSGSPVLNDRTGLVEGLIVRGDVDFTATSQTCRVVHRCPEEGCRGEDATKVAEFRDLVPSYGPSLVARSVIIAEEIAGNDNGYAEPGETLGLELVVLNNGSEDMTGATVSLSTSTPGARIAGTATTGRLAAGTSAKVTGFTLTLGPQLACAAPIDLLLNARFDGGGRSSLVRVPLGRQEPLALMRNVERQVPDADADGITIEIPAMPAPDGRPVQVGVEIQHPNTDHLRITVTAPDGRTVVLHNFGYAPDGGLHGSAGTSLSGTYGATLLPFESLVPLSKVTTSGTWKITVADHRLGLTGSVSAVSLVLMDRICD